jgi:para-nitrobenzyl esterase
MQRLVKRLARKLRIKPTREGFMSRTIDDMLAAQFQVMLPSFWFDMRDEHGRDPSFGVTRYLPVHGDDVLPLPAMDALRAGAGKEIDLLIGTTSEEANIFFVPGKVRDKLGRFAVRYFLGRAIPRARAALRAYGFDEKDARPGHVLTRAVTDLMFRCMTRRMAEAHQGRSYVYEFDWRSPAMGGELGAAHAVELPFVFDTLQCASGKKSLLGEVPPQELATFIHALWVKFAKDGDLPWPEYDSDSRQGYSLTKQVAEYEPIMPAAAFLP